MVVSQSILGQKRPQITKSKLNWIWNRIALICPIQKWPSLATICNLAFLGIFAHFHSKLVILAGGRVLRGNKKFKNHFRGP